MNFGMSAVHDGPGVLSIPRHRCILLVEDDPSWQMMVSRILKTIDTGIHLRCVRSMKHAEQSLYTNSNVEMVIADFLLEGEGSGLDLWRECGRKYPRLPFLLISGAREEVYRKHLFEGEEAPAFFAKPLNHGRLRALLTSVMHETIKMEGEARSYSRPITAWMRQMMMVCAVSSSFVAGDDFAPARDEGNSDATGKEADPAVPKDPARVKKIIDDLNSLGPQMLIAPIRREKKEG